MATILCRLCDKRAERSRPGRGTVTIVRVPVDTSWTFAPVVIASLIAYGVVYGLRWRTVRREGGPRAAPTGRAVMWGIGIALLFVALISPIDRLGEQFATFHMIQHLLIADLAPIALTLALTKWILAKTQNLCLKR